MRSLVCTLLFIAMFGGGAQLAFTQPSDSVAALIQELKSVDENHYAEVIDEIFRRQKGISRDSAKASLEATLSIAKKLPYKNAVPHVLRKLGDLHKMHKLYSEAYPYYEESIKYAETNNLPYEQAKSKEALGALLFGRYKFEEGVVYYLEAADLYMQYGYTTKAREIYLLLGDTYYKGKEYFNAIRYYTQVLDASSPGNGRLRMKMMAYNNIGLAYKNLNWLDSSMLYFNKSLETAHAMPDSFYIGLVYGNLAMVYAEKNEYEKAKEYLIQDVWLSKKSEEWESTASALVSLATISQKQGKYEKADFYLDSAVQIAQQTDEIYLTIDIYDAYTKQYEQQQNYQKAFEYLSLAQQLRDSLRNQLQMQQAAEIDAAYNFDKNLAEIDYLLQYNKSQSLIIGVFSASTLLLLVFSFILFRLNRQRTSANHQITLLNEKLKEKVKYSEEILRSAYENSREAFFIMRPEKGRKKEIIDFRCIDVNEAAARFLQTQKMRIVGGKFSNLFPFLAANGGISTYQKVMDEQVSFEQEFYTSQYAQLPSWIQIIVNPIEEGIVMNIRDISGRKEREQKIKESEASLSAMIDNTTDLILSIDTNYKLIEFNEPFAKTVEVQYGFSPQKGDSVFDAIHGYNVEASKENFDKALCGEHVSDHFEIVAEHGMVLYAEASFSPVMVDNQSIGATVIIRNITQRKQDEIQLKNALAKIQESQNFLNGIIENLPMGLQIFDTQGELLRMNQAQMNILGMTEHASRQMNVMREPFYKAYGISKVFAQAYKGEVSLNHEVLIDMGNDKEEWSGSTQKMWMSVSAIPVSDNNNKVHTVIGLFSDITERKEAEVALQESEERLRTVINNIPIILWTTDKDGIFTMSEGQALDKLALQPGQVVGISIFDLYAEYDDQLEVLKNALEKGKTYESIDRVGKTIFNAKVFPLRNERDEIAGLIGMSIDVTDRFEYEEKLKRSEANLAAIINNTNYSIWSVDRDFRIIAVNNIFKEAFRQAYQVEFSIGENALKHVPEQEAKLWETAYRKTLEGVHHDFEYAYMEMFYDVSMHPIIHEGQITGVVVFSQDVTERKLAEDQIRENQQFLNGIIENLPIGLQIFDKNGYLVRFNHAFQQAMNLPSMEYGVGKMNILKDDFSRKIGVASLAEQAIKGEVLTSHEVKYNLSDNSNTWDTHKDELWYNLTMFPIYDKNEYVKVVVVLSEDISERKQTEEKLIESEERLLLATKTADIGIWDIDLNTETVLWDQTMMDIYGLSDKPFENNLEFWNQCLHPDDKERVIQETTNLQHNAAKNYSEFRIIRPDGNVRYIKGLAQIILDDNNRPSRIIGVNSDITDIKNKEEKLKLQHQEIIETNKLMAEYKLMALRSVMNPHFLFNSLNSIQYFIAKNEREQALNYLSLFSKLIREVLNSSVNATIPIAKELKILKYYLELESLRFDHKFEVVFDIPETLDTENIEIPSLLIQPYVENAVIHGLYNKESSGKLSISLLNNDKLLKCIIEDDGIGREEALRIKKQNPILHKSVGMMVTKERLDIINKTNNVSVNVHDLCDEAGKPEGTRVEIFIQV